MMLSEYLKPAASVAFFVVLMGGVYWFEHRSRPAEKETQGQPLVVVTKSTNACFSDLVRVTGFVVPRRYYESVGQQGFIDKPVGSGPYRLVDYQRDSRIVKSFIGLLFRHVAIVRLPSGSGSGNIWS